MRSSALPVLLVLLSALSAAVYVVLQRDANRGTASTVTGWRLVGHLLRHPLWLLGEAAWLVAFGLQALALHLGRLSVVQPVLVTGERQRAPGCRGRSRMPARRVACFATSGAVLGALEAALVKTVTGQLSTGGVPAVLTTWQVYALAASGAGSAVVIQAALRAGPLTVTQPLLVVLNPLASTGLSVLLFGEHFSDDPGTVVLAGIAFAGVAAGVALLTATGPRAPAAAATAA